MKDWVKGLHPCNGALTDLNQDAEIKGEYLVVLKAFF